jgi:hypothetical protein
LESEQENLERSAEYDNTRSISLALRVIFAIIAKAASPQDKNVEETQKVSAR